MNKILKIVSISLIGLTLSNASFAWSGYSQPNLFGGYDYYFNDGSSYYSQPNIFGGYDYYGW